MRAVELMEKWEARAAEYQELGVLANGASLCRAFVNDLGCVGTTPDATPDERVLSLAEAAACSGYSSAHLARLVAQGRMATLRRPGCRGRLTFRASDLPRKPALRHTVDAGVHELASRLLGGTEGRYGRS